MQNILSDIKVLDLSSVLAGPSVGMFLGELGADVLKIENIHTGGDITRQWKNPYEKDDEKLSAYYASVNAFKKVKLLDLKDKNNIKEIYDYLKEADILICNFKYGEDKKLGLDYDTVKTINQKIIYGHITGFGREETRVAFDLILQAETGFMYLNREPHHLPAKMPVALIDVLAAHHIKEGILLALYNREKTGKGAYIHCSLYNAAVCSLVNQASNYLNAGYNPPPMGSQHPNIAPYGEIFETKDNKLITFAIGTDKQFFQLCEVLEAKEIGSNEAYSSNINRVLNRQKLYEELQMKVKNFVAEYIYEKCINHQIPVAIIKDIEDVMKNSVTQRLIKPVMIDNQSFNVITSIAFEMI
ncbi:MAG: CaiB/BaiF CoA-transferase family protein [Bacteroidia bacterium]